VCAVRDAVADGPTPVARRLKRGAEGAGGTFSVWEDQASLDKFAASDPHRVIRGRLRPRMSPTRFELFPISGADHPLTFAQITAQVS
jgi:hypothetical protein